MAKPVRAPIPSEEDDQIAVMEWLHVFRPDVFARTWHTPNGGKRHIKVAAHLRAMGAKPGIPDLITLIPRNGFIGLALEMKRSDKTPCAVTKEQREWLDYFSSMGFRAEVAFGYQHAVNIYNDYFGG